MPGRVVAANSWLEVSRSQVAYLGHGGDGGDVYRACVVSRGGYAEHFLLALGVGASATVKVAGGYVAVHADRPASRYLILFDPVRNIEVDLGAAHIDCYLDSTFIGCPGHPARLRAFALDRVGRVAWVESYTTRGKKWVRLRVRTQGGTIRTVVRRRGRNAILGVRLTRGAVRWSADGRVHTTTVDHPRCQIFTDPERPLDPGMPRILAKTRDVLVTDTDDVISGCLRPDGRWRQLLVTNTESSHGDALTNVLTAGTWIALNHATYPEEEGTFVVADLRSGVSDRGAWGYPPTSVDALAPDGRYVFHSSPFLPSGPFPPTSTRLYAAQRGKPDVQLDEGGPPGKPGIGFVSVFTDVQIKRGKASWKNAGVAKSAPLP